MIELLASSDPARRDRRDRRKAWRCRCDCGGERLASTAQLNRRATQCKACGFGRRFEDRKIVPAVYSQYARAWQRYLAAMSAEQRARFDEIMRGRARSEQNQREAVDVVMREPAPGICCDSCAARHGRQAEGSGQNRDREFEVWRRINQEAYYTEAE